MDATMTRFASASIMIAVRTIHSGRSGLDDNMDESLKADAYPSITYTLTADSLIAANQGSAAVQTTGALTIAGTQRPITMRVTVIRSALDVSTTLSAEAEANYGTNADKYGNLTTAGGRVQIGVFRKPYDVALRYAVISPDGKFVTVDSKGTHQIVSGSPIHEITIGATHYLRGEHLKIGVDLPVLIGAPVMQDAYRGAYVLTEQPDQATYVGQAGNSPAQRQTVVEARRNPTDRSAWPPAAS